MAGVLPDIAIRLADEGVPLRAIARATRIPSSELREHLQTAQSEGRLIDLPQEDWPPGCSRERRAPELLRSLVVENRERLLMAVQMLFGAPPSEANLLLELLRGESVCKQRFATPDVVNVHVHHLRRRLAPFDVEISTMWGHGCRLKGTDRVRLMDMIAQKINAE
jgi:hypothetical protein